MWLKLTDYGISRVSGADFEIRSNGINGTPGYIAPEILLGQSEFQADKVHCINRHIVQLNLNFTHMCRYTRGLAHLTCTKL